MMDDGATIPTLMPLFVALALSAMVTQVAVLGTTIFLHRTATHKALVLKPPVAWLFRLSLWITTGICTREWVAVHRKHHAFTDQEGDPHSPALMGFWSVQLGNVFHYMKEAKNPEVVSRYARDIEEDAWDRLFFNHGIAGLGLGILALCVVLGLGWGLLAAGIHAVMYVFVLSSPSTACAITSATGTSTTPRPTFACWRSSPEARAFTTITTGTRAARSSAFGRAKSIPRDRSSGCSSHSGWPARTRPSTTPRRSARVDGLSIVSFMCVASS